MRGPVEEAVVESEPSGFQAPRNVLQTLWQRRWLVLLGLAVGLVVGSLVYSQAQPVYRSSAQVLVIKKRSDVVPIAGGDPTQSYLEDYVSTHIVLLRSPTVVDKAVRSGKLAELKTFAGQGNPGTAIIASMGVTRDAPGLNRTIINLTYQGPYPEETPTILGAVIDSYTDFLEGAYRTVSRDTETLIVRARDLLKKDLAERDTKYRAFRENAPFLWRGKDGASPHHMRLAEIEGKRSSLLLRKRELEQRLQAVEAGRKAGKPDHHLAHILLDSSKLDGTKPDGSKGETRSGQEQLLPLVLEEQELLEDYGEDHPRVRSVRAKLARTRQMLERSGALAVDTADIRGADKGESLADRHIRLVKQELGQIEVSHKALDGLMADELKQAKALNHYELTDEGLRNDLARTNQLYEQTIKRLQEINLVRDFGGYDARVIAPAEAGVKVAPSLSRTLLMAALLGLLGGGCLAYLADVTDRSFRNPEEIRRRLGLPIMGHIPYMAGSDMRHSTGERGPAVGEIAPAVCLHHNPSSMDAEAYRGLRTALYFKVQSEGHKVIQITSPNMGDGKTTLIANLAVAIAQTGKRVVLVDADFRRPRLHRIFGLSATTGITSVLTGESPLSMAAQQTAIPGLTVLPCGTRPPNPADLLTSRAFEALIAELKSQYDYVLIDSPPLLAVTDPCVVAGHVDGILLALRVSKNGRPQAERAKELLGNLGVQVLGVVVNGIGREDGGNGYGYRYYYDDYRYQYHSEDRVAEQAEAKRVEGNGQAATT